MAKNTDHVLHVKSNVVIEGKPKLPEPSKLVEGELAINYAKGVETISIKNASGDIVTFSSDNYYTEQKLGSGFTGENSANTVTSVVGSGFTSSSITDVIIENEEIVSASLTDLDERKLDASAYTPSVELWESGTGENAIVQKGGGNTASGKLSIAMGSGTTASGDYSVAEGQGTSATSQSSHAEGQSTIASGYSSHAEGNQTIASGDQSHAEGSYTETRNYSEHASGYFNLSNTGSTTADKTLFSVGNGDSTTRHNAFEIRQNGDIYITSGSSDIRLQDYIGSPISVDQVLDDTTSASTNPVSSKAVYDAVTDNELVWTNAYVALSGTVSAHTANTDIHVTAADKTAWVNKIGYASYDSNDKKINFYKNDIDTATSICYIDASPFIVDGMVSNVEIKDVTSGGSQVTCLVISFNTDAGKQDINIPLSQIFDPSNYYTKTEVDERDLWVSGTGVNSVVLKGSSGTASGDYSVAEGCLYTIFGQTYDSIASGSYSHTEGAGTKASGNYGSHAEGQSTLASGDSSHAEGCSTSATTDYAHAEGGWTLASNYCSHAEGANTKAMGNSSHAEGSYTLASGASSHAEGNFTSAVTDYSHAEGLETIASGRSSHAEGSSTSAMSQYSHAEGNSTIANNQSEHASGRYNVSSSGSSTFGDSGNTLFSVGNGTTSNARHNAFEIRQNGDIYITSGGTKASPSIKLQDYIGVDLSNYYNKTEIDDLVGSGFTSSSITDVIIENEEIVSASLTDLDERKLDASAYTPSVELWESGTGENAIVQKGGGNTASGKLSIAMGSGTTASGNYSVAEGYQTSATSQYSHAEGYYTFTNGPGSEHAEGYYTSAITNSHAEGYQTFAVNYSHAEGYSTSAINYSHAEGNVTQATGNDSHAEGYETTAKGDSSHAEGRNTVASGYSSHAEGYHTLASDDYSHAEGGYTVASGSSSHAEGYNTTASGSRSHAEGYETIASGQSSHAEGVYTSAMTYCSHTEGLYTIANNMSEHASGQYNVSNSASTTFGDSGNTLFSVGNGTGVNAPHNAFEIRQNGDIYITSGNSDIKLQDYIGSVETVTAITPSNSGSTEPIATKVVAENELTVSNALTNLNDRKADTSAVTSAITDALETLTLASSAVTSMAGYAMAASGTPITSADTLNQAIGKLEKMIDEFKAYIEQKELAIAAALTDLDERVTTLET